MQPLNSSLNTRYSTGTRNNPPGYYVFAGDFRLCRYDPLRGRLYFRGRIMGDLEYEIKIDEFVNAIQAKPEPGLQTAPNFGPMPLVDPFYQK